MLFADERSGSLFLAKEFKILTTIRLLFFSRRLNRETIL
jgi:hypothetical protein